jgi:cellobiose phosphorylase
MDAVLEHLVDDDAGIVKLFTPPFDKSPLDPGYIKGYVPGVRENGGQYTHAAIWAVMAFIDAGRTDRAWELFELINPVRHGMRAADIGTYRVEPYVTVADVLSIDPHEGRGGWSWYTGSAGWMYRLILESILGIRREGARLLVQPQLPSHWQGFSVSYRNGDVRYEIAVERTAENGQETDPGSGQQRFFSLAGEANDRVQAGATILADGYRVSLRTPGA